jgi:hypothetical protein
VCESKKLRTAAGPQIKALSPPAGGKLDRISGPQVSGGNIANSELEHQFETLHLKRESKLHALE